MNLLVMHIFFFIFFIQSGFSQNFEGIIEYKIEFQNLNQNQDLFDKQVEYFFGNLGYMTQRYYFGASRYKSDIIIKESKSYQLYDSDSYLLYSWSDESLKATKLDVRNFSDEIVSVEKNADKEVISNISCKSTTLKFQSGKILKLWFNDSDLNLTPKILEGHKFNYLDQIVSTIGCLPIRIEEEYDDMVSIQTLVFYKEKNISKLIFVLPNFNEIAKEGSR